MHVLNYFCWKYLTDRWFYNALTGYLCSGDMGGGWGGGGEECQSVLVTETATANYTVPPAFCFSSLFLLAALVFQVQLSISSSDTDPQSLSDEMTRTANLSDPVPTFRFSSRFLP